MGVPGDLTRPGARPLHFLRRHGYPGRVYPVNPRYREIGGLPAYPDVGALPEPVDVAWIGLPAPQVAQAVEACGRAGIPFAVVLGSGFAEAGPDGAAEQARLRSVARQAGVRVLGPNAVGFVNAWDRVALTFSTLGEVSALVPGPLGVVSQSGGLGGCLTNLAYDRGVGVGLFVATGNEADLGLAECLEWLVQDGRAGVVACVLEQVRDPEGLARAVARGLARGLAVVALKLGRSAVGARAARSHTGALVGRADTWQAWARATGILAVDTLAGLLDVASYLARRPPPAGDRLAVVTSSGGIAVLLADALASRGFRFPALQPETRAHLASLLPTYAAVSNPVDVTAGLPDEVFGAVLAAVLQDPGVDAVLVPLTMATADGGRARAAQVVRAAREASRPLAVVWPGGSLVAEGRRVLDGAGVPWFADATGCAAALAAAREWSRLRPRLARPADPGGPDAAALPTGPLPWETVRALLEQAGVRLPREVLVRDPRDLERVAAGLPYPVVAKRLGPLHRTEGGGVRVGLRDASALARAVLELLPGSEGCVVQPQVEGVEVLVGAVRDPELGTFVLLAPGGVHAELYGQRALRPAPVEPEEVDAMLEEVPALRALLAGYRGAPPADVEALGGVVAAVSRLALGLGTRLVELDVNPVIVGGRGEGALAVDARIILNGADPATGPASG